MSLNPSGPTMQGLAVKIDVSSHTNPAFQIGVYTTIAKKIRIRPQNQLRPNQADRPCIPLLFVETFVEALLAAIFFFLNRLAIGVYKNSRNNATWWKPRPLRYLVTNGKARLNRVPVPRAFRNKPQLSLCYPPLESIGQLASKRLANSSYSMTKGAKSVADNLEAVLHKIENWH